MNKSQLNKNQVLIISIFLLLVLSLFLHKNISQYYTMDDYPDANKTCFLKPIVWDKSIYSIHKYSDWKKIVLKVENRHKNAWSASLLPIQKPEEQFTTCMKSLVKLPKEIEDSIHTPEEIKQQSKGLELSIGIQEPFKYTPIAHPIFTIRLFSSKFNTEKYNLDQAIQNIAENIIITEKANNWYLQFNGQNSKQFNEELPFDYYLVQLNGKDVNTSKSVQFVSKDNGQTWTPVVQK